MNNNWDIELAKILKERDNAKPIGNIVGRVVSSFPNVKISILDNNAILTKDKLYCCNSLLSGYSREATITGNIQLTATTSLNNAHTHSVEVNTNCNQTCTINFTDTLNVGDFVLLQHSADETKWFIVDRITKL